MNRLRNRIAASLFPGFVTIVVHTVGCAVTA